MNEMIERVAQVLWECDLAGWNARPEQVKATYRHRAKNAIAAMREPTKAMVEACVADQWRQMIDGALADD